MYVINPSSLKNAVIVPSNVGKFIEKHYDVFAVNKHTDNYYFSNTEEFRQCIKYLPFWLKCQIKNI